VILAEVSAPVVSKGKLQEVKKERKKEKVESKNGAAWTANYETQQILAAYGAGDASKPGSRGCSSLHSAYT
jgi:hypothetical protein